MQRSQFAVRVVALAFRKPFAIFAATRERTARILLPPPSEQRASSSSLHLQARCTVGEMTSFVRSLGRSAIEEVEVDSQAVIGSRDGPLGVDWSEPAAVFCFGRSSSEVAPEVRPRVGQERKKRQNPRPRFDTPTSRVKSKPRAGSGAPLLRGLPFSVG